MPGRAGPPLLSFSQSIYLLITLFRAYTVLGLALLRVKDALPERPSLRLLTRGKRTNAAASAAAANAHRRSASGSGPGSSTFALSGTPSAGHAASALAAATAQLAAELNLDHDELQQLLIISSSSSSGDGNDDDDDDYEQNNNSSTAQAHNQQRGDAQHAEAVAIVGALKNHARAVYAYHTFLHYQRTAGLQPSLTARLPRELVRKIMIHAGVPTRRATRSPYELPASPVAVLSLSRAFHAALLPKVYHAVVIDRPRLFRSLRMTLSSRPPLSSSATIRLPQPGDHIRTLHIGSAFFGDASTVADLIYADEDDEDGNADASNANRRNSLGRRSVRTEDAADSDEEGYLPTHLASHSHLATGIELILLASPQLHTLSLDFFALTALVTGTPRRFSRAPRPRVLRCELAIPQSLSLRLFRDVQAVELLCFGMDAGSALELCAALPRGCTEITLRFVRRRRTYAHHSAVSNNAGGAAGAAGLTGTGGAGGVAAGLAGLSASAASRARQATRAFFGLDSDNPSTHASAAFAAHAAGVGNGNVHDEEDDEEEEEEDDFHSVQEAEEAVRNLAAAVRVLQFSGRSPSLFSQPPMPTTWTTNAAAGGSTIYGSSPASSHGTASVHAAGNGGTLGSVPGGAASGSSSLADAHRRDSAQFSIGSASPYGTPRAAHAMLAGSPHQAGGGGGGGLSSSPLSGLSPARRGSPALAFVGLPDHHHHIGTPPTFTSLLGDASSPRAPVRVSEFFHPDAVPPPNSVVRLHSMDSSYSSSLADESSEGEENDGTMAGSVELMSESPTITQEAEGGNSLGLEMGEERRISEDAGRDSDPSSSLEQYDDDDVVDGTINEPGGDDDADALEELASISSLHGGRRSAAVPIPMPRARAGSSSLSGTSWTPRVRGDDGNDFASPVLVRGRSRAPGQPIGPASGSSARGSHAASSAAASALASASATPPARTGTATPALLPPELHLTSIRVLAWPAALRRLRQCLPDADRIADEPSGRGVLPADGKAALLRGENGKGKGKGKGKARDVSPLPPTSAWADERAGRPPPPPLEGMPALGPYPATLGLGLDSVHARGPRRGVQELWSAWAREEPGGLAV